MHIISFREADSAITRLGVQAGGRLRGLRDGEGPLSGFAQLLRMPLAQIRELVEAAGAAASEQTAAGLPDAIDVDAEIVGLPPLDGRMEVWAAGVTYSRSRDARMEESTEQSVYDRVYGAERPELFFKSVPWRVVTGGDPILVRADSPLNVPEPELAVVINAHREIVGYTVCDDVSSRSIEGENPLYLPQAKVYEASCAVASVVRPAWEIPDALALTIRASILRAGVPVWSAETSTSQLHRSLPDLIDWLFAAQDFPDGVVLSTGTGIVPPMEVTLLPGDEVSISIDEVGELANPVGALRGRR